MKKIQKNSKTDLHANIIAALQQVYDPELPVDIYALGLIYEINIDKKNNVQIVMTLTSMGCPASDFIIQEVQTKVRALEQVNDVQVQLTFDPPYSTDRMSLEAKIALETF